MSVLSQLISLFSPGGSEPPGTRRVEPQEAARLVREKQAVLVDVREPPEWAGGVAAKAALLPLSDLSGPRRQWKPFLAEVGGREILLYCRSGSRSGLAARILAAEGFRAANAGTLRAWVQAGLPVCQPKAAR
ncbi:MAG TPA: rhodanese-like domain-containing protein [Opitutaceae bacterium]|nr:rhodanese-like domain-containing protein [Opitutaceae bacterium]